MHKKGLISLRNDRIYSVRVESIHSYRSSNPIDLVSNYSVNIDDFFTENKHFIKIFKSNYTIASILKKKVKIVKLFEYSKNGDELLNQFIIWENKNKNK